MAEVTNAALAIVISLQAVGNVLVLALLITPAGAARLLTDRLGVMMLLAPAIGAGSSVAGLYLSYIWDLAAGGLIVLTVTAAFLLCWFFAPRHGLLAKLRIRRTPAAPVPEPQPKPWPRPRRRWPPTPPISPPCSGTASTRPLERDRRERDAGPKSR